MCLDAIPSPLHRGGFPSRAWVWINGVLHEAHLTGNGEYHGFPLDDPKQYPRRRNAWRTYRVSPFLSIDCDPIDQPAADDPVERRTWCMLRIRVAGRTVTRLWDLALQQERSFLYVPAFPIAEWVVVNWWVLLNETCPKSEVPGSSGFHLPWIKRHCLRCADSALLLPALYFFNDGRGISVEWQADPRDTLPHMPGKFVNGNGDHLDAAVTQNALGEFVNAVLARVKDLADERGASDPGDLACHPER